MLAALKTHVGLREALEIEAIKCAAGDARHDYQEWYPRYKDRERQRSKNQATAGAQADDFVDPAIAAAELVMIEQAIRENETLLAEHRTALVERRPSPLSDVDVDAIHEVLASLRANKLFHEQMAAEVSEHADDERSG